MKLLSLLFAAFGVAVFIEGLPYFISPTVVRRYMAMVGAMSDAALRGTGMLMMIVGLLLFYFATR